LIVFFFGLFLLISGLPFGLVIMLAGPIMFVAGLILPDSPPVRPLDPNLKYCRFCLKEIPMDATICPECGLPPD
jgi:hypothetical protein